MAGGLTYANTLGAIDGINQSGSGVTIPDTFLRWAQDVLFDNNGIIKRRAPFKVYPLYNTAGILFQPVSNVSYTTSGGSWASNVVTLTINNHVFTVGQPINVVGLTTAAWNGNYIITATTTNTISYANATSGSYSAHGTVTPISERVVSTISTINPSGDRIMGLVVTSSLGSRILFYDGNVRGPYVSRLAGTLDQDCIFDCKSASVVGMWLGFLDSYTTGSSTNAYYQYFWRGGCGVESTYTGTNTSLTVSLRSGSTNTATASYGNQITMPSTTVVPSVGMFVYAVDASGNEFYLGTVASANATTIVLEKDIIRPGTTNANARTDWGISASIPTTGASGTGTTATLSVAAGHPFSAGQVITVSGVTPVGYNGTYTITGTTATSVSYASTTTGAQTVAGTITTGLNYAIKTYNIRPYVKNHSRGLMTLTTGASATITSGNAGSEGEGHWKSAALDSGSWALYRASDGAWLGDVGSVTDNTTMVGSGTYYPVPASPIVLKADEYVARPYATAPIGSAIITNRSNIDTTSVGVFSAVYAGYQWFGNAGNSGTRNRIVFSNYVDSESVDLSANGSDSIIIPSLNEMRGLASSSSGLLIFMADKTFILRGNSRFNFSLEELYPEGCLSSMSIVEYGGGVFWASKTGIFYFDGSTVRNLTKENLGNYYSQSIRAFNTLYDRIYGFFHKDYVFYHFTSWKSTFNPVRYEPIYADGIDTTPAIADFHNEDWDPDFTIDDFALDSNTPIYWSYNTLLSGGSSTTATVTSNANIYQTGVSIISAVGNGTNVVFSLGSSPFTNGQTVRISGCTPSGYNGTYTISAVNTTTNTITVPNTTIAPLTIPGSIDLSSNAVPTSFWNTIYTQLLWGPPDTTESFTLAIYLPTGAVTTLSNFGFRGSTKLDSSAGLKTLMGINMVDFPYVYPRFVDVDSVFNTEFDFGASVDEVLIENNGASAANYHKGPDFYIQTKHYTMGDPLLKKWFRQVFLNLYLIDGCMRLDFVDNEDNDIVDVRKKQHKNWELFTSVSYTWDQLENYILPTKLSPNRSTWQNVENLGVKWYQLTNTAFERRKKRFSWRSPSVGFRLYQINNYRPNKFTLSQAPFNVILESWDIGFKPMRQSRV